MNEYSTQPANASTRTLMAIVTFVIAIHAFCLFFAYIHSAHKNPVIPPPTKRLVVQTIALNPSKPKPVLIAEKETVRTHKSEPKPAPEPEPQKAPEPAPQPEEKIVEEIPLPAPPPSLPEPEPVATVEPEPKVEEAPPEPVQEEVTPPKPVENPNLPKPAPEKPKTKAAEKISKKKPTVEKKIVKKETASPKTQAKKTKEKTDKTKTVAKKTEPKKNSPPKPDPRIEAAKAKQRALIEKAQKNIANIGQTRDKINASKGSIVTVGDIPGHIESLQVDALFVDAGNALSPQELSYHEELASRLKLLMRMPEYGDVKIKLTLDRLGKYIKASVVTAQSNANKKYVEKTLPKLTYPRFGNNFSGHEEYTFVIVLSNDA